MRKSLYQDEQDFVTSGKRLRLMAYILPLLRPHVRILVLCAFFLIAWSLLSVAGPLLIRHAIDVDFVKKDIHGLFLTVFLLTLTLAGSFVFGYLQQIKLEKVGQSIIQNLREELFKKINGLSMSFFDTTSVGAIISRIESDTEALRLLFTSTVVTLLGDLLLLFSMFVVMFAVDWRLAAILFTTMPILFLSIYLYSIKGTPLFLAVRRQMAEIYGFLEEYLRGMHLIQIFSREKWAASLLDNENRKKMAVDFRAEQVVILFINFIFFMNIVGTVLVLSFGCRWVSRGMLTVGTLVMFLAYIRRFFAPLFHLSEQLNIIQRAFAGAERINDIMSRQPAVPVADKAVPVPDELLTLEFDHVWFAYHDETWVLQDISFHVPAGERWAIVGATGSGKTTIINLIMRFYDPQRGRILINGVDIRSFSLEDLRRRIGFVLQDIFLFPASIRENLRLDRDDIDDARIFTALKAVQADHFVRSFPQGLDTDLAERGQNISMGERQLLSFARALLREPKLLVLDEATSSIDPMTEGRIQQAMTILMAGRTTLIIAHRLQTITECDTILVIDKGRVVERGPHRELLDQRGIYYQLYNLQHHDHEINVYSHS